MNRMCLSMFLPVVDGCEEIRVVDSNTNNTIFYGKKYDCPFLDVDVTGVWTHGGKMVIAVI